MGIQSNRKRFITIACFLAGILFMWAQGQRPENDPKKTKIILLHADQGQADKITMPDVQVLIGDVRLRHDSMYMFCDSALIFEKTNSLEAFGNVRMEQGDTLFIYGDYLFYDGQTQIAELRENVRMINRDRDAVLDENVRILYYDEVQRGRGISGFVNMASGGSSRPKLLASRGYTVKVARSLYPNASSVLPVVFYAPEKSEEIFNYSPYPRLVNGSIKYDYLSRKVSLTSTHCSDADYTRELELRDYDRGWNLIGSTFGSDSRFSTPNGELGDAGEMPRYAYVDDAEADGYRYVRRGEATIGSFQSIFLQIPTNRELYFNGASRVTVLNAPALYVSDTSIPSIHLSASDGARSDRFTIEFDPDGSDSYQMGYDLGKMLNGSGFNFYSLKGISPCAVQNVPLPDDGISIPVCLTTLRAGVHALSLEENTLGERYRVSLIDPSGVSSDLIASNDSIRFEAPASGEYTFLLQVRPRLDTSLSRPVTGLRANLSRSGSLLSVSVAEEAARLRVYTVSGDLVASADLAPSAEATLSVPAAGILIVTVHTASASETYKLIP